MCYPISMKRFYLFFIFTFLGVLTFAQDKLFALEGAQSSVYAKYIDGEVVLDKNSSWRLNPASIVKLFTTAAALDTFGPDYTFETKIYFSGIRKGNKIKGDIYIVGGGDPSLASKYFDKSIEQVALSWVDALKKQGITTITGNIYGDNTLFKDNTLPIHTTYQNIGNYFAAPSDALTIKDNNFSVYFEPSGEEGEIGKIAKISPQEYEVPIEVKAYYTSQVSREDTYLNFVPLSEKMQIRGRLPLTKQKTEVLGAIASPALFTAKFFKAKLMENGIKVKGKALVGSSDNYLPENLLYTHLSAPLKEIVQKTNKRSLNLYADILLRHLGKGSAEEGIDAIKSYLEKMGIDSTDTNLFDGSGLARSNSTTCKTIVSLLEQVQKQPYGQDFIESLSVVGDENDIGNMSNRMKDTLAVGKARVKTGSIEGVRAHAGYVQDRQNKLIAFCVISNNFTLSRAEIDALQEEIILSLASLNKKADKRTNKK
jgi:D-alanyl-D-alanine carboxypeptidase, serine-type, PBP4 family